jgi:anti-sigma factor ChrR (cupin superfamily)
MQEEILPHLPGNGPDLLSSPHALAALMELFAGDKEQALAQQEQVMTHLTMCHYCRTAVMVLLTVAQEYDRRHNEPEEPTRELLNRFAETSRAIEARQAREFERLAAYAEAILSEGQEQAARRYPDVAAHLNICSDCQSALEATVAFLTEQHE